MLTRGLLAGFLVVAALTRAATADVIPPPITDNLVNFDNIPGTMEIPFPGPLTTELAFEGVIFSGFGQNGGAVLGTGEGIGLPENLASQLSGLPERVPDGERRPSPVAGVHRLLSAHHVAAVRHRHRRDQLRGRQRGVGHHHGVDGPGIRCGWQPGWQRHGTGAGRRSNGPAQLLGAGVARGHHQHAHLRASGIPLPRGRALHPRQPRLLPGPVGTRASATRR